MMSKRLTIKDIARMAGVSPTVVSFVINNKAGVSPSTRKKVLDLVDKTNFKPNITSRRLVNQKSYNITVITRPNTSPFSNPFYTDIAQGVIEKSRNYEYNIIFSSFNNIGNKLEVPSIIEQRDTDGVIFFEDSEYSIIKEVERRNIPYVILNTHNYVHPYGRPTVTISANYEIAAYVATKHLVDNGHTDIGFVTFNYAQNFYINVFNGFKKAIDESGIVIPLSWIQTNANDELSLNAGLSGILDGPKKPTAIFCASDLLAINTISILKARKMHIPEDISIISIDDIILSRFVDPKLTTIKIDQYLMGQLAMDFIARLIKGEKVDKCEISSDTLIERETVKKI